MYAAKFEIAELSKHRVVKCRKIAGPDRRLFQSTMNRRHKLNVVHRRPKYRRNDYLDSVNGLPTGDSLRRPLATFSSKPPGPHAVGAQVSSLEFDHHTRLLCEPSKRLRTCECAENSDTAILHDIVKVVGHDALEEAEELVTTLDGQEKCVCVALGRETKLDAT
ncbi:hypothetical protein PAXINDRAFT_12012 [Paxillus involutus ATCC 200175]|uniref:Uncharacterized protein n=1 Tax=Paxillus involutus ATCC 200175 TaxID=664439 RepID=A0A0C9U6Q4_PAXIN|nr:hypothetical protein PAXINDRAFT_12012 [Paxillus involutus ATCC 200175]